MPLPKVLPLTKTTSGKMAAASPAPTPAKIKLMSRPQVFAPACAASKHINIKSLQVCTLDGVAEPSSAFLHALTSATAELGQTCL